MSVEKVGRVRQENIGLLTLKSAVHVLFPADNVP